MLETDGDDHLPDDSEEMTGGDLLREWVPLLVAALLFALVFRLFLFQAYSIPSTSMLPGLEVKDRVLVNKLSYVAHDVNRGDVVVFDRPPNAIGPHDVLIKRVIGLPGERVDFIGGEVYVDDQLVQESYIASQSDTWPLAGIPNCINGSVSSCTVPEGHVLVLGDNRARSTDGRSFGPVPIDSIVGRAFVNFWPPNDMELI